MWIALAMLWQSFGDVAAAERRAARVQEEPEKDWKVALSLNMFSGIGSEFNDLLGGQLTAAHHLHRLLGPGWWVRADGFQTESDFENPGDAVLGTSGTPVADASISMLLVSLGMEWHPWNVGDRFDVHVGAGVGFATMGDGDARNPPTIDIEVTGNSGATLYALVGGSFRVAGPVYLTGEFRVTEVLASLDVRDRLSGTTGSLDRWTAVGFTLGVEVRF